ncbi:ABC transporter permease [Acrocarpospora catenulata]|uniref:ABC transporter permease n=1 Tax=Acrocarpospora catenulata TaxID=2836182 RepID=UPI001BD9C01A|nr:ABC transporter permease [Acrocarpospora catenulata]
MDVLPEAPALIEAPVRRVSKLRRLLRDPSGLLGVVVLGGVIFLALLAPWISPHDPERQNLKASLLPPAWLDGGDSAYLFGTDRLGHDVLSRTIWSARTSLLIGFSAVALAVLLGVTIGVFAGYVGGRLEDVVLRLADIQLAIPPILLAIVLAAAIGPSPTTIILVLGGTGWVVYARITRGDVLSLRDRSFVKAAVSLGAGHGRVVFRHILPHLVSPILIVATIEISLAILAESSLSFLGLGIQPPTPSWGSMLGDGRDYLASAWWLSVFPGIALMLTVLSVNLVGNWLRDVYDPRLS